MINEKKYFALIGKIDENSIKDFIAFCNENQGFKKVIFIDSDGGFYSYAMAIATIINAAPDEFEMIAMAGVMSSAAELFFEALCERRVMPSTCALIHESKAQVSAGAGRSITNQIDAFYVKQLHEELNDQIEFWRNAGLNEHQLKVIKSGKDLMLNRREMIAIIERQKEKR